MTAAKKAVPRKAAPRKAAPRRTAAGADANNEPRMERITAFEDFRMRGKDAGFTMNVGTPPYVLGPEKGFDPPVTARWPETLVDLNAYDLAWRRNDPMGMLRALFGPLDFQRILMKFDDYARARNTDSMKLLVGLSGHLADHFVGDGASKAGGTAAS